MKKILIFVFLVSSANCRDGRSFQDLQEAVKERGSDFAEVLLDARREQCRAEALANRVQELAENTRLFLQELDHCSAIDEKKRGGKSRSVHIKDITKKVIPVILKLQRQVDRIERSIEKLTRKKDTDRKEFREANIEVEKQKITKINEKNPMYKKMIKLGTSFRKGLDESKTLYKELLGVQLELAEQRSQIISIEAPYIKVKREKPGPLAVGPGRDEPWDFGDWVSSLFGGTQIKPEDEAKLREEFERAKAQRKTAEEELSGIKVSEASSFASFNELDEQIKSLGQSIQVLSANIDSQLEDLHQLTENIAKETLSKVDL